MAQAFQSLLPLLLLFLLPLLSSLFSGGGSSTPANLPYRFDGPVNPYTQQHQTSRFKVPYWVNPVEVEDYSAKKWKELDSQAEKRYISTLNLGCERERIDRSRMVEDAQGFFFNDENKMEQARQMPMRSCKKLEALGVRYQGR